MLDDSTHLRDAQEIEEVVEVAPHSPQINDQKIVPSQPFNKNQNMIENSEEIEEDEAEEEVKNMLDDFFDK